MGTDSGRAADSGGLVDFGGTVGAFFVFTKSGKLDVLAEVRISSDLSRSVVRPAALDLSVVYPMTAKIKRSNLVLAIHTGEQPKVQFLMTVTAGRQKRSVHAMGTTVEIITRALDNDNLPILVQTELEQAIANHRGKQPPIKVPIRMVELRPSLPDDLLAKLRDIVLVNARQAGDKMPVLEAGLQALQREFRGTLLHDYLMKCLWLNLGSGLLGNLVDAGGAIEFAPFDVDDEEIVSFLCALEKDIYGDFQLDFREFANVLPTPKRDNPWLGPTVHVYKADFRKEHGLEEYYSLYKGFQALCAIGAPILIYTGQDPLTQPTPIRFLKITDRSINLLQGKILEGNLLQAGVRDFTSHELVWK